jgi:predicted HicB family RNase H-like nuclease
MSILGYLLAFAPALAARREPVDPALDEEIARLRQEIAELKRELATELKLMRDEARRLAIEARERREEQEQHRYAAQLNAQMAMQAQAMQAQLAAIGLSNPYQQQLGQNLAQQSLLGTQGLAAWAPCTCVPDRARALRRPPG